MRTTITLDDDLVEVIARHARLRGQSLGKTVSELVRRGLQAPATAVERSGLVMFKLPDDSPTVTTAEVRRIESEGA
jgi:Arc/MetJ family transcription regulator